MINRLSVTLTFFYVLCSTHSMAQIEKSRSTLEKILNTIGKSENIIFTIESGYSQGQAINAFQLQSIDLVENDDNRIDLSSLKIVSENVVHKFTVIQSGVKSNVYHVIDVRLLNPNANPLDEYASNISFKGATHRLVEEVGKMNPHFEALYLFDSKGLFPFAFWLDANIQAKDVTFRELFTKAVDLSEKKANILWVSQTNLNTKKSSVYYY